MEGYSKCEIWEKEENAGKEGTIEEERSLQEASYLKKKMLRGGIKI